MNIDTCILKKSYRIGQKKERKTKTQPNQKRIKYRVCVILVNT